MIQGVIPGLAISPAGFQKVDFSNVVFRTLSVLIHSNEVGKGQIAQNMMKIGLKGQ
jgi:hypothetical protein